MPRFKAILVAILFGALVAGALRSRGAGAPPAKPGDPKNMGDDGSAGIARVAPSNTGDTDASYWRHLSEEQQNQAVAALKTFAQKSADSLKHPLHLHESRHFLFYSDLSGIQAARYLSLLDRMYGKLSDLFGLQKGDNLWRGKSLVIVFNHIEDYREYERLIENDDPGGSFAITHCFGDGMVHMALYRYPDDVQFEHLLVHESVHGFLHRYRSPARIPSWANEGLADEAASELIFEKNRAKIMVGLARAGLAQHHDSVGDFFTASHIDGWQYPIAETLCAWMIHHDRDGYLAFINGIKDGQPWDESLKKNFKMSPDKLLSEYGKSIGVKGIKM
ncbi:MAG TPA: hypothetical protein VFE47_23685 [Tepidisphaeraceae bacterium]|jgi:hypothetical protein|nr:hypothetical protein [Tepidisphaeraceae bacterium]